MTYRFLPSDPSVESALRRIAGAQLAAAAGALRGEDAVAGVHEARKAVKKTRALLRLLRPGLRRFGDENRQLRQLGRLLAPLRDAEVSQALLARLCDEAGVAAADRQGLSLAAGEAPPADPAAVRAAAAEAFEAAAARSAGWRIKGDALAALEGGLRRSTQDGRAAMDPALETAEPELLHGFRKRAKDRWYHARLMAAVWPEAMAVEIDAAGALAERLGDHQDLAVLADRLCGEGAAAEAVRQLIRLRRGQLLAEIAPLARRLYAERPKALARRRLDWWRSAEPGLPLL